MRILHLSTWETGGAAIAATRLSTTLNELGETSDVLHMSSRIPAYIDAAIGKLAHSNNPIFHSYNYFGENISAKINKFKPDLIHIHWTGAGFITPESMANFHLPIVWTLHDLWPLCGAEHLPGSDRMKVGYRKDNRLVGESGLDLDRLVWERKLKSFKSLNITYIAPSHYVYEQAKQAKSLGIHKLLYIPNGVDTTMFKPVQKTPSDKLTILYVANNPELDTNKGYADFRYAIDLLPAKIRSNISVKVAGGEIKSELQMASLYQSATVTVVPSKIENLPYVAMESLACGAPVVSYRVGGIPDLVGHKVSGYLARPYDVKDLALGIETIISSPQLAKEYGAAGRDKITQNFNIQNVAKRYLDLYHRI